MQTNKSILIFSVFSGTTYNFPEIDIDHLTPGHLPLNKQPKSNCKKCFGRGYTGRDPNNSAHVICSCVQKVINFDILKVIENKHSKLSR